MKRFIITIFVMLFCFGIWHSVNAFEVLGEDIAEGWDFFNWEKDEQITISSNNTFQSSVGWKGIWKDFFVVGKDYKITIAGNIPTGENNIFFHNSSYPAFGLSGWADPFEKTFYLTANHPTLRIVLAGSVGVAITKLEIRHISYVEFNLGITSSSIAGIMNYSSNLLASIWKIIALIIGLPMAFWVVVQVIGIIKTKQK